MDKWCGWAGTILDVDLTTRKVTKKPLSKETAVKYIGGSGLGARILYDEVGPEIDPLSPENILMIAQGPLSGTIAPSSGRYEIITKSPQTGIFLRSNGGGFFGPEMKWAGYDLIIVRGKSEKPVYLWIDDDDVEIREASHLWGKDTWTTQQIIRDELGDPAIQTLKIGPAGENLSLSSCTIGDLSRAAGKGGSGAVWGSKLLKAIAVRGTKGVNIARPDDLLEICNRLQDRIKNDPLYEAQSRFGTPGWVSDPLVIRSGPGNSLQALVSTEFEKKLFDKSLACFNCPIHCSHFYTDKEGEYGVNFGEGVEANCIIFAGPPLGITDPAFICKYTMVCNQLGLHIDQPGCAISWAMELYEENIITQKDTDGIELTWGNTDAILKMLHKIAYREGFGEILDSYPLKGAEKLGRGSLVYAPHVKGLPGRGSGVSLSLEFSLALAVATRGRDHLIGAPTWAGKISKVEGVTAEVVGKIGERLGERRLSTEPWYTSPKKASLVYELENTYALCDMTGICKFASEQASFTSGYHKEDFAALLSATTGINYTKEDVVEAAEREMLIERAFNAKEGIRRIDDYPIVFHWQLKYKEPHPKYKNEKLPITMKEYDSVLDEYYRLRGCDPGTGVPKEEKLEQIGLKDIMDDLVKRGVIHQSRVKAKENS